MVWFFIMSKLDSNDTFHDYRELLFTCTLYFLSHSQDSMIDKRKPQNEDVYIYYNTFIAKKADQ